MSKAEVTAMKQHELSLYIFGVLGTRDYNAEVLWRGHMGHFTAQKHLKTRIISRG